MWDGVERRRFSRVQYPCLITVFKKMVPSFSILTHTENISVGGLRVIIGKKIEVAEEVDLEIDLKDTLSNVLSRGVIAWVKRVIFARGGVAVPNKRLEGKIAWVREIPSAQGSPTRYDTGIQFIGLKKTDEQRIERIIDNFMEKN